MALSTDLILSVCPVVRQSPLLLLFFFPFIIKLKKKKMIGEGGYLWLLFLENKVTVEGTCAFLRRPGPVTGNWSWTLQGCHTVFTGSLWRPGVSFFFRRCCHKVFGSNAIDCWALCTPRYRSSSTDSCHQVCFFFYFFLCWFFYGFRSVKVKSCRLSY